MRKRISKSTMVVEKVYSVKPAEEMFTSFKLKGRQWSNLDKLEKIQEREIRRMFKYLTVKTMMDEKTYLRSLRERSTIDQTVTFVKEVAVPQNYEVVQDIVLGAMRVGKNYLKTFIEEAEVVKAIGEEKHNMMMEISITVGKALRASEMEGRKPLWESTPEEFGLTAKDLNSSSMRRLDDVQENLNAIRKQT